MRDLLAHAATLGVSVHVAHLPAPYLGWYEPERRRVVYDFDLTHIERRCVLAHELGHAFHDHQCEDDVAAESVADLYAARLLINPAEYAQLEGIYPFDVIADELRVTPKILNVFLRSLVRMQGATYTRPRMGKGQFSHAWSRF